MSANIDVQYPLPRTCPFNPPPGLLEAQRLEPIKRVKIWDGSIPWLITRYKEAREILSDRRMSSNSNHPGYPFSSPGNRARRQVNRPLINMDGAEHQMVRRMLTRDFMVTRARDMRPRIQNIVSDGVLFFPSRTRPAAWKSNTL